LINRRNTALILKSRWKASQQASKSLNLALKVSNNGVKQVDEAVKPDNKELKQRNRAVKANDLVGKNGSGGD
jgi:hypothetical protein